MVLAVLSQLGMATIPAFRLFVPLALAMGLLVPAAVEAQAPTLGITLNDQAIVFGESLVVGVTVDNPGGGPLADFYFVILLPDGSTVVSAGPGVGARVGTIGNLRTLVPVARNISLANRFPYQASPFFTYTFTGIEPQGTYRIYFAAFRAGALNDGVIGGGELLAVASRDFTVSAAPALTVVDTTRQVTTTVPPSGGAVQTSAASGTTLRLAVPAGGVNASTTITIAPLAAFNDLPLGPLVAGVSAEPSGLQFATPATLTITLPQGYQIPVLGLSGFIADSSGRNLQTVPITIAGNVITMQVPHFSVAGVALNDFLRQVACTFGPDGAPPEQVATCGFLTPLFEAELARLAVAGGPVDDSFRTQVLIFLFDWLQQGLLPRLLAAQTPDPTDPNIRALLVAAEWLDWTFVYRPLFGLEDRTNTGPGIVGAQINLAQERLRLVLAAGMNAVNIKCLTDKAKVRDYVRFVLDYRLLWTTQFGSGTPLTLPFDPVFCVDLRIDAAPSPVLTPGSPSLMPVDLRVRFIDGVDLPGPPLSVAMTATNATITPAGGVLPSPIAGNVTLTPTRTSTTVTITAAFASSPAFPRFDELPVRTRTFSGGQPTDFEVTRAGMTAEVGANLPTRPGLRVIGETTVFAAIQSVSAPMIEQATDAGTTFRTDSLSTATRTVALGANSATITGTFSSNLQLSAQPPLPGSVANVGASSHQFVCFNLPRPFEATYMVQTNVRDPSDRFNTHLRLSSGATERQAFAGEPERSVVLPANLSGSACIQFVADGGNCRLDVTGTPVCRTVGLGDPTQLTGTYTVTLRPAP